MSKIFVGAKEANLGFETGKAHPYLVYENDAGARFVTSLTDAKEDLFPPSLRFNVEQINTPYDQAREPRDPNRVERELDLGGRNADAVWNVITQHAEEIKAEKPTYHPLEQNSISFIASLLNVVGIDFASNLPGFNGNHPTPNPQLSDYPGIHNVLDFNYTLIGTPSHDIIRGAAGNDRFWGEAGDDTLIGKEGFDTLDGGPGVDTAGYRGPRSIYTVAWTDGATVSSTFEGVDRLHRIEALQFTDTVEHITPAPLDYIASYPDLMAALGANAAAGFDHYLEAGFVEGRTTTFDGMEYIASYGDLITSFRDNADMGTTHYITQGRFEGRSTSFDGLEYIASYGDLTNAFHTQVAADPNTNVGANHYILAGYSEGRTAALFDPAQYLANYADLQAAFGTNTEAATFHYITAGYFEGRTDQALA